MNLGNSRLATNKPARASANRIPRASTDHLRKAGTVPTCAVDGLASMVPVLKLDVSV